MLNTQTTQAAIMSIQAGIYFTGCETYAAITQHNKQQLKLLDTIKVETIDDSFQSKQIAINKISSKVKHKLPVIIGLQKNEIFLREMSVDNKLSESEIVFFLKKQLHTNYFDFEIISTDDNKSKLNIVAASNTLIENYIKIFQSEKFYIKAIDIDIFALQRITNFHQAQSTLFDLKNIYKRKKFNLYGMNFLTAFSLSAWGKRT